MKIMDFITLREAIILNKSVNDFFPPPISSDCLLEELYNICNDKYRHSRTESKNHQKAMAQSQADRWWALQKSTSDIHHEEYEL